MHVVIALGFGAIMAIALIVGLPILAMLALYRRRRRIRQREKLQASLLKAVEKSVRPSRWWQGR